MNSEELVRSLKKLDEITALKEVTSLTNYVFPGTHCPLMGAALVVRGIEDAMMLVIGTDECSYYTKSMAMGDNFGGIQGRCTSVIVDSHDITFGSVEKTESAVRELMEEYKPSCLFLVTTCVIEIIGDDFDSLADSLSEEFNIPILPIHTEHFKSQDHIPGIERSITACFGMMKQQECDGSVNVLGQRLGNFDETELYSVMKDHDIKIGLTLPSGCTCEDIVVGAKAKVNLVVHSSALPLAKKMKKKFGTPYVAFERMADPERVLKAYSEFFGFLDKELPNSIQELYDKAVKTVEKAKKSLQDVSYVYGNTPYAPFEINCFMAEKLGMIPALIQLSALKEEDRPYKEYLEQKHNPYVTRTANIAPLQHVYDVLSPNLYLGHEYADRLQKKNIALVHSDRANSMLGFDAVEFIVSGLVSAAKTAESYRNGTVPEGMPMGMMGMMMGKPEGKPSGHPAGKPMGGHPAGMPKGGM